MFKTDSFLGNKKSSSNQNVWRDHATMQQDVLFDFWVIFLYWNQTEIWKSYSTWKKATKCTKHIFSEFCDCDLFSLKYLTPRFSVFDWEFIIEVKPTFKSLPFRCKTKVVLYPNNFNSLSKYWLYFHHVYHQNFHAKEKHSARSQDERKNHVFQRSKE